MRILSILLLLCLCTSLPAQGPSEKWLGVNNVFFKNQSTRSEEPFATNPDLTLVETTKDQQYSLGLSYRIVKKEGRYRQFDFFELDWRRLTEQSDVIQSLNDITEPARGQEITELNGLIGYQIGRIQPIFKWLQVDYGGRGFVFAQRTRETPFTSASFPFRSAAIGVGVNAEIGLIFIVHQHFNIAFHVIPLTIRASRNESYLDNPILTARQRRQDFWDIPITLFDPIGLRSFSLNYVF